MRTTHSRFLIVLGGIAVVAISAPIPARGADWSHCAGDAARSSHAQSAPPNLAIIRWHAEPAADEEYVPFATPVASGGRVFAAARYYANNTHVGNRLIAYRGGDGERLWATPIDADIYDSWSSPVVDERNGRVMVASGSRVFALDVSTGAIVWITPLARSIVNASPAVTRNLTAAGAPANRLFVTDFNPFGVGTLYAINIDPFIAGSNPHLPGGIAWTAALNGTSGATPACSGGMVAVATVSGQISAFDALSGGPALWATPVGAYTFFGGVTIRKGHVYAASYRSNGGQTNSRLVKLNLSNGQVVWTVACERTDSIPVVTDTGQIYLSGGIAGFGSAVKLQAFQDFGPSATLLWDTFADTGGSLVLGGWTAQPLFSDDRLFLGKPSGDEPFGLCTDLFIVDTARLPTDPAFVRSHHYGSGGSCSAGGGCVFSIGVGGLYAFCPLHMPEPGGSSGDVYQDDKIKAIPWGG